MTEITPESLPEQLAALEKMTATDLRRRYAEVFGERARSGNRQWLHRRIAWRLQLLASTESAGSSRALFASTVTSSRLPITSRQPPDVAEARDRS